MAKHLHGHATKAETTRTYRVWTGMRSRVSGLNSRDRYFDRGIDACDRWSSFEAFLFDMGEAPDGMSLERINNNLGYSAENCRWATPCDQANNRRDNRNIEFNGRRLTLAQWAREAGCSPEILGYRLRKGMSFDAAIATPVSRANRKITCL